MGHLHEGAIILYFCSNAYRTARRPAILLSHQQPHSVAATSGTSRRILSATSKWLPIVTPVLPWTTRPCGAIGCWKSTGKWNGLVQSTGWGIWSDSGLGWLWSVMFHHLAQLLGQFCQFPISLSRTRQIVGKPKSKSNQPSYPTRCPTLYFKLNILTILQTHWKGCATICER